MLTVWTWRGCSRLEGCRTVAWRETNWPSCLRGSLAPWWFVCLRTVLSLKDRSWLPFKPLEICIFGKAWCEVMSNNRPWQCSRLCLGDKQNFSSRHENSQSRSTSSCDVGNKYVCVVGCRSGVAFFTVARVLFKSLFQDGACEGSDQNCVHYSGNSYWERKKLVDVNQCLFGFLI